MKATFAEHGLIFHCEHEPVYSFGVYSARRPVVHTVELQAIPGGGPLPESLTLSLPEIGYHETIPVDPQAKSFSQTLNPRVSPEMEALLEGVSGRLPRHIEVEVDSRILGRLPITVLPGWEWSHAPESRVTAAAYVLPGDQMCSQVVVEASASPGSGLLPDLIGKDPGHAAERAIPVVYRYLAEQCEIVYETPRLEHDGHSGFSHQRVRAPHEILPRRGRQAGRGNCFDLTLLMAGCLEGLGLNPLLFFLGDRRDSPSHAFLGCWKTPGHRLRPFLTDPVSIRQQVGSGDLCVIEATGVCRGARSLSHDHAAQRARAYSEGGDVLHALDISACRPPVGAVRSVDLANTPEVQRAFWAGHAMARDHGARHYEALHILYGLCAVDSGFTGWVLQRSGGSANRVRSIIERSMAKETPSKGAPAPTVNHDVCVTTSRANARNGGRPSVTETDLLWAVLQNPSRNVEKVLDAAGCDRALLARELDSTGEHSLSRSVSRSLAVNPGRGG